MGKDITPIILLKANHHNMARFWVPECNNVKVASM